VLKLYKITPNKLEGEEEEEEIDEDEDDDDYGDEYG
jgi:hypothetical protein